ncbi:MAG: peptidylprolyl isomerase [Halieaceae bacterium]|nr:peptidylprolyl isomerase [Halieaceae bacterium]
MIYNRPALFTVCMLLGVVCAGALSPGAARGQTQILDSVVAIVEDDVIMASELRERLALVRESMARAGGQMPPQEVIVRDTLDRLILESIQLQKGRRVGVRVSDAQLNGALNRIAAQNNMTLEQFRQQLELEGKSYEAMRENVRTEFIIQRVQQGNVNQRVEISDQEVDNFLESEEGKRLTAEEFHLIHALLPVSDSPGSAEDAAAGAKVNVLFARIEAGEPFDQVIGTSGLPFQGGDLGWRTSENLPSLFADVAPGLKVGETAAPLRSASGYHLVLLAEKRGGEMLVQQTKVRHILLKPSAIRSNEETRQLAEDLRRDIIEGEDFGELAREYSEDIGSAQEGGDLGWATPGQMVPTFENTMDATEIGAVSQPFESQYGWHILEVLDRRQQDMSDLVVRNRARELLHQRKYEEELDAWLRKIRDEAFVDIK